MCSQYPPIVFAVDVKRAAFQVLLFQPNHPTILSELRASSRTFRQQFGGAIDGHLLFETPPGLPVWHLHDAQSFWEHVRSFRWFADADAMVEEAERFRPTGFYEENGMLLEDWSHARRAPDYLFFRGRTLFRSTLPRPTDTSSPEERT